MRQVLAKERGVDFIIIEGDKYKGSDEFELELIAENWVVTPFWQRFGVLSMYLCVICFVFSFFTSGSFIDKSKVIQTRDKVVSVLGLLDHYKDWNYFLFFPHSSIWTSFILMVTLIVPIVVSYQFGKRHGRNWKEIAYAYIGLGSYDVWLKEVFITVIGCSENLPQVIIFFQDTLWIGNRMTFNQAFFPILSIGFYSMMVARIGAHMFFSHIN